MNGLDKYMAELLDLANRMREDGHDAPELVLRFAIGSLRGKMSEFEVADLVESLMCTYANLRAMVSKPEDKLRIASGDKP